MKQNHHFIPRFWLRAFRDSGNNLHARIGAQVKVVSVADVMQENWLYTIFDSTWQPSDALEDGLSRIEGMIAPVFQSLGDPTFVPSQSEHDQLCLFLGLQACRHPDILNRGFRRARELARLIASVHTFATATDFVSKLQAFGIGPSDGMNIFADATRRTPEQLATELLELEGLSPQDPRLPVQDALRAFKFVAEEIHKLTLTIVDASPNASFILGDTPMPQNALAQGFTIPVSKAVAFAFVATRAVGAITRRAASASEVQASNTTQWRNSIRVVVGPDPNTLRALP